MPSGACNRHTVEKLKEIKIQRAKQGICGAILWVKFAPGIERCLGLPENLVYGLLGVQLFVDGLRISLIGNCKLIFQVGKAIVDWSSR